MREGHACLRIQLTTVFSLIVLPPRPRRASINNKNMLTMAKDCGMQHDKIEIAEERGVAGIDFLVVCGSPGRR